MRGHDGESGIRYKMKTQIESFGCPICGFLEFDALQNGNTTFDICPSCGAESGNAYQTEIKESHLLSHRKKWFTEKKGAWWSTIQKAPAGWSPREQLIRAGLTIPSK